MQRRAFRVAYDGRPYTGFQRQPDVPTVEDALFGALARLDVHDPDDHRPPGYAAAGRTDAGVSALAQTVALDCPDWLTPRAFNSELPASIRAWASAEPPADFHATHDATRRAYAYHLYAPVSDGAGADPELGGSVAGGVDDDRFRAALDALSGEHDFDRLTPDDRLTVRRIEASATREGDFLAVRVAAGGFPRGLVRRLVSLARAVGTGAADLSRVAALLDGAPADRVEGVPAAPPTPLVLVDVSYPGLDFTVDPDAAASARAVFAERHVDGRVVARVADAIRAGMAGDDAPESADGDGDGESTGDDPTDGDPEGVDPPDIESG